MKPAVRVFLILVSAILIINQRSDRTVVASQALSSVEPQQAFKDRYCVSCHNDKLKSGGFSWSQLDFAHPEQNAELAEKVVRKVRAGMMPPAGAPRADAATMKGFAAALETRIDQAAASHPY